MDSDGKSMHKLKDLKDLKDLKLRAAKSESWLGCEVLEAQLPEDLESTPRAEKETGRDRSRWVETGRDPQSSACHIFSSHFPYQTIYQTILYIHVPTWC